MAQHSYQEFPALRDTQQGSRFKPYDEADDNFEPGVRDNHVAKLQGLVYTRFGGTDDQPAQMPDVQETTLEYVVSRVSRMSGVVLFFAALAALAYMIF